MNMQLATYHAFLERVLTPYRLRHSLGVMQMMGELAPIYGLDIETALTAGLLHDAAKDLPPEQRERIIAEAGLPCQAPWERDYVNYMHGPVGALFVRQELGIRDAAVLDAITMHTFCGAGEQMESALAWCLRFSDLLEPNRRWDQNAHWFRDGGPRLRELAFSGRLAEAAFFQSGLLVRFFEETGQPVHPNIRQIYQQRARQLGQDDSWFVF